LRPKSMRKLKSSVLLLLVSAVCLPQSGTNLVTPDIRRVGDRLACKCGACNNTIATCSMLQCHYSHPAREKIGEMQKAGIGDQQIVDAFVKEQGLAALASPPMQGFYLLGWIMPFIALGLGLGAVTLWIKRFRKPAPLPVLDVPADDRYSKRIEQELADLD
jgi:cytochrome c-type biogenesis protein CcmH/NrfF